MGQAVRIRDWLLSRVPEPPPALRTRLAEIAGDVECADASSLSAALVLLAEPLLSSVGDERSGAVDLLAADALITYAMESAAESCENFELHASHAMTRAASPHK